MGQLNITVKILDSGGYSTGYSAFVRCYESTTGWQYPSGGDTFQIRDDATGSATGVPARQVISISARVYANGSAAYEDTGYKVYNTTTTLNDPAESKDITITIRPSTIPADGIVEMGYEEITFDGKLPQNIQPYTSIPSGSNLHFLWGIADFKKTAVTVKIDVVAVLKDWDNSTVLWTQSASSGSKTMTYLDDMDFGPINLTLPQDKSGYLNVKFAFTGIEHGSLLELSNQGAHEGLACMVGINPNPNPPPRTGTGEAQNFTYSINNIVANTVAKPGQTMNASVRIRCMIKQGDPDAIQRSSFWCLLKAKDSIGSVFWTKFVQTAYQMISEDGAAQYSLQATLPQNLDTGTLEMTFGGDCINRWQGDSPLVHDTKVKVAQINSVKALVEYIDSLDSVAPGEILQYEIGIKNIGNIPGTLSATIEVLNESNGIIVMSSNTTDNSPKNPGSYLIIPYAYQIPKNYSGDKISLHVIGYHMGD